MRKFALSKQRLLGGITLLLGSTIVGAWTIFRLYSKSVNFDLVGQQLLARQWLDGNLEGAVVAPTNYIMKMIVLYIPGDLGGIDPKVFLVATTLILNILTFVGLYFILRKILAYFSVRPGTMFNLSMLWLATVAGSVFWIQFANSRNIELLAGMVLLYLGLLLYQKIRPLLSVVFIVLAGVTYFMDPLQLFVTTTILVAYIAINTVVFARKRFKRALVILALVVAGYVVSQGLVYMVQQITRVDFFSVSSVAQSLAVLNNIPMVIVETAKNVFRLVAGTNEASVWRKLVSGAVIVILTALALVTLLRKREYEWRGSLVLFIALMLAVPVGVYVASGQPVFQADTSRYLIVVAPALVLLFSLSDLHKVTKMMYRLGALAVTGLLALSIAGLFVATMNASQKHDFLGTAHLEPRYSYLSKKGYEYGYASMDTAIPAMYFLGKGKQEVLLPLSCNHGILRKGALFYDKRVFTASEKDNVEVPIILDGTLMSNHPSICTVDTVTAQLGEPKRIDMNQRDTVLIYDSAALGALSF